MFNNRYVVKIEGKNPHRFLLQLIKMKMSFFSVKEEKNFLIVEVDDENYQRLIDMKTIYDMSLLRIKGPKNIQNICWKMRYFFLFLALGLILLWFLTNIIFEVEVIHTKKEIRELLYQELREYNISPFHFCVSFERKEEIRNEILKKHKDTLEWIEIERIGTKYEVRVEERKLNPPKEELSPRDIVAKKDGLITKIEASTGEIVAKKNQYVRKGDILVTGVIKNKEDPKAYVPATGNVYAETWYKVTVSLPLHYHEEKKTGKTKKLLQINFLGKNISLLDFNPFKDKNTLVTSLIKHTFLPLSLNWVKEEELEVTDISYSKEDAIAKAKELAEEKVLSSLDVNARLLSQKELKITEEDSKIIIELFLKVEENITDYAPLQETEPKEE